MVNSKSGSGGHRFPKGAGGKSEQDRARWWLTATRGDPRESATENTQPMSLREQAMVKWCGKSAPRRRRRRRQGKPHRLQDQAAGYSARVRAVKLAAGAGG